jgi:hypothetical protein
MRGTVPLFSASLCTCQEGSHIDELGQFLWVHPRCIIGIRGIGTCSISSESPGASFGFLRFPLGCPVRSAIIGSLHDGAGETFPKDLVIAPLAGSTRGHRGHID